MNSAIDPSNSSDKGLPEQQDNGRCLCLSGGGFRASAFHLGAIRRLNELGVLANLAVVSSVSGGSILNGLLATRWSRLKLDHRSGVFANIEEEIGRPLRQFCSQDLRTTILLGTRFQPSNVSQLVRDWFSVSANFLAEGYEPLFRGCHLADLPNPGPNVPRFVFCSTNVQTGACWHFHGGPASRMGDFYTGYCDTSDLRVSDAVAASSAFPPGFSAFRLPVNSRMDRLDPWGQARPTSATRQSPAYTQVLLTDGGVYDNLAVEPVWSRYRQMLVSDAGQPFESLKHIGQGVVPRLKRASEISMEQVAAVRKRWLVADFLHGKRAGAIWTLKTRLEDFTASDVFGYSNTVRGLLHIIRTDLNAFSDAELSCLENHGYSIADAAMRSHAKDFCANPGAPFKWPFPKWRTDDALKRALKNSHKRQLFRDVVRYCLSTWSKKRREPTEGSPSASLQ